MPREEFVETARLNAFVPYSAIMNGQWYQRGEMGWFGMSSDEMSRRDWANIFREAFSALPDDHIVSVIDCHI